MARERKRSHLRQTKKKFNLKISEAEAYGGMIEPFHLEVV